MSDRRQTLNLAFSKERGGALSFTMASDARSDAVNPLLRTASSEGVVQLQHPTPDLQSLQGAYVQNVERLEERAERMSSASSDIGEEIRKLQLEQKLSDSRRSSMMSNAIQEEEVAVRSRSRNVSTSSYSNSIVDVNNTARYGGYSPGGYVTSPKGSLRSGSWSQVSFTASIPRQRSISKGSRLGQVSSLDDDEEIVQSPVEDPTLVSKVPQLEGLRISTREAFSNMFDQSTRKRNSQEEQSGNRLPSDGSFTNLYNSMVDASGSASHLEAPRVPSDTSFTDVYNQIATEIREQLYDAGAGDKSPIANSSIQPTPVEEQRPFIAHERSPRTDANDNRHSQFLPSQAPLIDDLEMAKRLTGYGPFGEDEETERPVLQIHRAESVDQRSMRKENLSERPMTAASADTYQQAQSLFRDFDGAHYEPSIRHAIRESSGELDKRRSSMLKSPPNVDPRVPPPAPGMVFYPAPVPRTLNLPQRLSQMPSAAVQARRRTQMLSGLPPEVRKSMPWLSQEQGRAGAEGATTNARRSMMNMAKLPPQLRASMFFETPGSTQEVEMIDDSAVATFDGLLDASASAPVNAFIDHPFAGRLGADVYRKEKPVKSTSSPLLMPKPDKDEKKKRRSSMLGIRRNSIATTEQLRNENNKTPSKLQRRNSRSNSLAGALDDSALARGPRGEIGGIGESAESTPEREGVEREADDEHDDHEEAEEQEDEDNEPEYQGPPTTLLAELQQRKAQQKQRNRTAATAFPNGMHATLLEMDAVAQVQRQKRKKARVTLAWEDPAVHAATESAQQDDEDVPLGMLFPGKNKRDPTDWNRPLGLLEKKELEDNEPLSRRRNRLLGIDMARRTPSPGKSMPELQVTGDDEEEDSEHEGETLAERIRRLKNQKELDQALGEVTIRPVSTAFSTEMLSELGIADEKEKEKRESTGSQAVKSVGSAEKLSPNRSGSNTPDADETLGQRRARLQREAMAQARRASHVSLTPELQLGDNLAITNATNRASTMLQTPATTPPLRSSRSMADLLQAFPAGKYDARKISNEALTSALPPGSLLAKNEQKQAAQKARINDHKQRTSSCGFDQPLVDLGGMTQPFNDGKKSGGFMGGIYNRNTGGMPSAADQALMMSTQQGQQATMMYGYQNGFSYPNMGGMQNYPYGNPALPQNGYAMGMGGMGNPLGYPANMMYAQQPQPIPLQHHSGIGMNGFGSMANPNLLLTNMGGNLGRRSMANLNEGTYQPSFQRQSTMPNLQGGIPDAFMDQKERERIDAWRLGIT